MLEGFAGGGEGAGDVAAAARIVAEDCGLTARGASANLRAWAHRRRAP